MNRREFVVLLGGASIMWLCGAGPALAVPEGVASGTAEMVCELRALAAQHPDPKLKGRDHLAAKLCNASLLPRAYADARPIIDVKVP